MSFSLGQSHDEGARIEPICFSESELQCTALGLNERGSGGWVLKGAAQFQECLTQAVMGGGRRLVLPQERFDCSRRSGRFASTAR